MNKRKAILIVSAGSTHLDALKNSIDKLAERVQEKYPEYKVCQAFSVETILRKMKEKMPDTYFGIEEMLDKLEAEGVKEVAVLPACVIQGGEHEKLREILNGYKDRFDVLTKAKPLLSEKEDYLKALEAVLDYAALEEDEALMLVGHGTHHHANTEYQNLEYTAYVKGCRNVFVATLEGHQKTAILMRKLQITGCKKIRLMPLLLVAGKHAKKDIAGDGDSWKTMLTEAGYEVCAQMTGIGELDGIQNIFIEHLEKIMDKEA